jgi:hypothetical protein
MTKMNELIEWLNDNPWLNLVFLFLAIASIIVSFLLYFKSKKIKKPTYLIKSFNLIKRKATKIKQVKLYYDKEVINNLTVTKVSIWNKGNQTINNSDVAPKDPLRIEISNDFNFLSANIAYVKKEANNFKISLNKAKDNVIIDFDYFHTGEGVIVELYHTGTSSDDIKLFGTIKDVKSLYKGEVHKEYLIDLVFDNSFGLMRSKLNNFWWKVYMFLILPILVPILIILMPFSKIYEFTKSIPKEFYLDDE